MRFAALSFALTLAACDGSAPPADAGPAMSLDAGAAPSVPDTLGPAARPAAFEAPPEHDGVTALPLVVLLHGYGASADAQNLYFQMTRAARAAGMYLVLPDGTDDGGGSLYWDIFGVAVDDSAYIRGLIDEAREAVPVSDVFLVGHSNGGFMSYQMACDHADVVTGIASLAGSDATGGCVPSAPVSVLQIHGTADPTVRYDGGTIGGFEYIAAPDITERWSGYVGCDVPTVDEGALDLTLDVPGAETDVTAYPGCEGTSGVELWTMNDAGHIPGIDARSFTRQILDWLAAHGR